MARFTRALTVLSLAASLIVLPMAAEASPRLADDQGDSPSLLTRLWERVSSLWGAGGGSLDPSGVVRNPPLAAPLAKPAVDRPAADERERRPSSRRQG